MCGRPCREEQSTADDCLRGVFEPGNFPSSRDGRQACSVSAVGECRFLTSCWSLRRSCRGRCDLRLRRRGVSGQGERIMLARANRKSVRASKPKPRMARRRKCPQPVAMAAGARSAVRIAAVQKGGHRAWDARSRTAQCRALAPLDGRLPEKSRSICGSLRISRPRQCTVSAPWRGDRLRILQPACDGRTGSCPDFTMGREGGGPFRLGSFIRLLKNPLNRQNGGSESTPLPRSPSLASPFFSQAAV